ncbi:FecCD family ABC transporter permease [Photobacterium kishitanii]|uniref:FecCD family ABC transporter permease n=1 Tax=Photobacterium kishitanii TaxID=318456 RepID=UPI000AB35160|nr:iron ABC transporter permease [Photobacterium kishitanii]
MVKYVADPNNTLPSIVYWLMGSFNESRYTDVIYILLPLLTVGIIIFKMRYVINILSLGEEEASSMGVNVNFSRWVILLSTAILIAASVSVSGIIGWVGLIIPHFARMIVGSNHGKLIPISMFIGAIYLILVDVFARTVSYGEIPIGVITAIFGAPIFAWLLYKSQLRGWRHD